ncbi:major facilitator superfamily domain-containing protein [Aspergillus pseudotamarii]|uniref:Major facilitator superfamily domain-containing protein n=1 Tax=Aspergillus pseudotamarii TaxID=132259 RepID=A0A5N6T006_ASPPS|nr:major facilitator superfamily domain-containing protein [Aspergillus pseudotamarii]KAE8139547.1 major facilitator superfamily domain-containing protein [Aspergillus pseudotamarii]
MAPFFVDAVREGWYTFTPRERRNVAFYILGIMLYKFGLEAFNGSIVALATNRYDYDAMRTKTPAKTFQRVGLMVGLNQACQCIGSILIAPLIRRFPSRVVLSSAVLVFALFSALLLIIDASTGGTFVPASFRDHHPDHDFHYYGRYNTDGMIPVYCVAGIAYGMVELMRRVIPRDIVGGNVKKLRHLDALVHIFYEVSGTSGAFCTALALIPFFGNNYSFLITPICFAFAAIAWFFLTDETFRSHDPPVLEHQPPPYIKAVTVGFWLFVESIWTGARIIFTSRKFIWLVPGYSVALYAHRYLENAVAPAIARRYLGNAAWSQIIVGGSNLGELLGALFVILFTNLVTTPVPWLRLDAVMLLITWYLPFWRPSMQVSAAWMAAATFIPISFGWAAGDVSLAAYIQATLARVESKTQNVSALGAVMAFLYSTYIILYAITSPILGSYIDQVYSDTGGSENGGNIYAAIQNIASVQFTIISGLVLVSTFVPRGSLAFNPKMLYNENLDGEAGLERVSSDDLKK